MLRFNIANFIGGDKQRFLGLFAARIRVARPKGVKRGGDSRNKKVNLYYSLNVITNSRIRN